MNEYVERLSSFLLEGGWDESNVVDVRYRTFVKYDPKDLVMLDLDMRYDLFLLHLQEFGFETEDEFNLIMSKI